MNETALAGVESRAYVLGGMHPDYATPPALDALVQEALTLRESPLVRARIAANVIRGWVTHRG